MKAKIVGIIGGGQLAMMLCEAARSLDIKTVVFAETDGEPAKLNADTYIIGKLSDSKKATEFLDSVDVVTVENEFIDCAKLEEAIRSSTRQPMVLPLLTSVRIAQDKLSQKELFNRLHLKTAKHIPLNSESIESELKGALERFPAGCVIKWAKFGYDGKGNFVLSDTSQIHDAVKFCQEAAKRGARVYAEEKVTFDMEVAMVYCRTRGGDFVNYPLVISEQHKGICKVVQGPATRLGIPAKVEADAAVIGQIIGETLQMAGTFAIEFFYGAKCGLMINEMAPRVHNSGHYTLNCSEVSQFENHIRAVAGKKLGAPITPGYFGMLNLLGPDGAPSKSVKGLEVANTGAPNSFPYWYRKAEARGGRKMGHVNLRADSPIELVSGISRLRDFEDRFWKSIYG